MPATTGTHTGSEVKFPRKTRPQSAFKQGACHPPESPEDRRHCSPTQAPRSNQTLIILHIRCSGWHQSSLVPIFPQPRAIHALKRTVSLTWRVSRCVWSELLKCHGEVHFFFSKYYQIIQMGKKINGIIFWKCVSYFFTFYSSTIIHSWW